MGTYGGYSSRGELVAEVTKSWENEGFTQVAEKKFFSGNDLWVLFARTSKHASTDVERFIVLFKISRWGEGNWAYKPIEESMGPLEHSCPVSFLDAAQHPFPNGYPEGYHDWRANVRAYHARKNQKLVLGQIVKLTNNREYKIATFRGRKAFGYDVETGGYYHIPRRMLTSQEAVQS
jgi:hypothetical protein